MRLVLTTAALILSAAPALAVDYSALREDPRVSNGLLSYAVAVFLRDNCPDVSQRTIRGSLFLLGLQDHATSLGYSSDEVKAYVDDETEQKRVKADAMTYLHEQGLPKEPTTQDWCGIAALEVEKDTPVPLMIRIR